MIIFPDGLMRNTNFPEAQRLRRALTVIGEELPQVYDDCVLRHHPRDNTNVFGLRVYVHAWAAAGERSSDLGGAQIVEDNNSFHLRCGEFKIGIHNLGHHVDDDIHECFPGRSPTQRAYGERNARQMQLFQSIPLPPLPAEQAFALRNLIVGHFGNPRQGLLKWYVGAYVYDHRRQRRWAWTALQEVAEKAARRPEMTRYSEREVPELQIPQRPREGERQVSSEGDGSA